MHANNQKIIISIECVNSHRAKICSYTVQQWVLVHVQGVSWETIFFILMDRDILIKKTSSNQTKM